MNFFLLLLKSLQQQYCSYEYAWRKKTIEQIYSMEPQADACVCTQDVNREKQNHMLLNHRMNEWKNMIYCV